MGKLLFVDNDDVIINSSRLIQHSLNEKDIFLSQELESFDTIIAGCRKVHEMVKAECERAQKLGVVPELGDFLKNSNNDIIRSNGTELTKEQIEYILYVEPVKRTLSALKYALLNKEMFLERRDCFLENDNLKSRDEGVVDYNSIYTIGNVNQDVITGIRDLDDGENFERIFVLSHHNGGREIIAKKNLINEILPDIPFLGLRFHLEKPQANVRRPRSSKALYIKKALGIEDMSDCYLIDDSLANVKEWLRCGGKAILYKPFTNIEIAKNQLEESDILCPRIFEFNSDSILDAIYQLDNHNKGFQKKY